MSSRFRFKSNRFRVVKGMALDEADKAIRAVAFVLQEEIQNQIGVYQAIDTGALRNSVYTETAQDSTRATAVGLAQSVNPDVELGNPSAKIDRKGWAKTGVGVNYGTYVHEGGSSPARPFMADAVSIVSPKIKDIVAKVLARGLK